MNTYLTEIPHRMAAVTIRQRHHIKQERFHVVVQRFMVEEEFGQQAQMLTVLFMSLAIHLPHAKLSLAIDLQS